MKLLCHKHQLQLTELFCPRCYDERVADLHKQFKGQSVTVSISGVPDCIDAIEAHHSLLPKHHMQYLEYYLPAEVYADACKYIEKRMKAYIQTCPCASCLLQRNTPP